MAYATPDDLLQRYPERDLVQLTDESAQEFKRDVAETHLEDASDEIDGYLEGRVVLPLAKVPRQLVRLCCEIAVYRMQPLRREGDVKDARQRYKDIVEQLEQVAARLSGLGLSAEGEPVATSDEPCGVLGYEDRVFSEETLKDY